MPHVCVLRSLCLTALGLAAPTSASAQAPDVEWSGLAFIDYEYLIASDDPQAEGDNTFDYRRIYLTADAALDEAFDARVRLEARGRSTTAQGRPAPFVKDAWVRWTYAASGHNATLGVQPPPLFEVAERVWGYRSLDATVVDRADVRDSRDFGLRLDGPVAAGGDLSYGVMVGNGNGVRPEADGERGKRVYGQLAYTPGAVFRATLGADYSAPTGSDRVSSVRTSAFAGAVTEAARGGVEAFYVRNSFDAPGFVNQDGVGVSVFGAVNLSARTSVVARYDYLDDDAGQVGEDEHYVLGAFAYRPIPAVSLMPNVIVTMPDGADATVLGRFTTYVRF